MYFRNDSKSIASIQEFFGLQMLYRLSFRLFGHFFLSAIAQINWITPHGLQLIFSKLQLVGIDGILWWKVEIGAILK